MASHGDTAEGGTNEEFSDIIKWRSGKYFDKNLHTHCRDGTGIARICYVLEPLADC